MTSPVSPVGNKRLVLFVGGSSGLGFAAIESLLAGDDAYHIVLASRYPLEAWRWGQIHPSLESSGSSFDRLELNLSHYSSVHQFVETFKQKYPTQNIDTLVLVAGMIAANHRRTSDGEDETLQVNVLSHALLIDLLDEKLGLNGRPTRVLFVGSSLHKKVPQWTVAPDNIDETVTRNYDPMEVYQVTKLLQVFLFYLAQERFESKPNVTVVEVSPGFVPDTGLSRELGMVKHGIMQFVLPRTPFATTLPDGGRHICRGITHQFQSGTYFTQRNIEETSEETYDPGLREQWKQWLIAKRVWHQPSPTAAAAVLTPLPTSPVSNAASSPISPAITFAPRPSAPSNSGTPISPYGPSAANE